MLVDVNSLRKQTMSLLNAEPQTEYIVKNIMTDDEEFSSFLFTLGCYAGERIVVVAKKKNSITIVVKDARYTIDKNLAEVIEVEEA